MLGPVLSKFKILFCIFKVTSHTMLKRTIYYVTKSPFLNILFIVYLACTPRKLDPIKASKDTCDCIEKYKNQNHPSQLIECKTKYKKYLTSFKDTELKEYNENIGLCIGSIMFEKLIKIR